MKKVIHAEMKNKMKKIFFYPLYKNSSFKSPKYNRNQKNYIFKNI